MTEFQSTTEQRNQLISDWAKFRQSFSNEAPPRDTPRTWGFEIETPEADELHNALSRDERELMEFCEDSSIEGYGGESECECECRWCYYHECNCDSCEVEGSDDPSHDCGSSACYTEGSEYQEVKLLPGGVSTTHPEALTALVNAGLETVRITDQCGLHLNIGSRDLTPNQVARVVTAYRIGYWLFSAIAGRESERFAKRISEDIETNAKRGNPTEKMTAVNTCHHFYNMNNNRPNEARIEFRQHAGENSASEIRAWAWLLCELVEFAKTERPFYWLARATTLAEFRKALT
jgi:hypothetical protein